MDKASSRFRVGLMLATMGLAALGSLIAVLRIKTGATTPVTPTEKSRERHAKFKQQNDNK